MKWYLKQLGTISNHNNKLNLSSPGQEYAWLFRLKHTRNAFIQNHTKHHMGECRAACGMAISLVGHILWNWPAAEACGATAKACRNWVGTFPQPVQPRLSSSILWQCPPSTPRVLKGRLWKRTRKWASKSTDTRASKGFEWRGTHLNS